MASRPEEDPSSSDLIIDSTKSRRKKKYLLVKKPKVGQGNGAPPDALGRAAAVPPPPGEPRRSFAGRHSPGGGGPRGGLPGTSGGKKHMTVARKMEREEVAGLRAAGTAPVPVAADQWPQYDKRGRVVEKTIIGTRSDFEAVGGKRSGDNTGRSSPTSGMSRSRSAESFNQQDSGRNSSRGSNGTAYGGDGVDMNDVSESLAGGMGSSGGMGGDLDGLDEMAAYRERLEDSGTMRDRLLERTKAAVIDEGLRLQDKRDAEVPSKRLLLAREDRTLEKWAEIQRTWAGFKTRMAKQLGKDVNDLVVSRSEEFRERVEEYVSRREEERVGCVYVCV